MLNTDEETPQQSSLLPVYPDRGLSLSRGDGVWVEDERGMRYLDCVGGWGVANIGHGNQIVADAIYRQAQKLITCSGIFANDVRDELANLLVDITHSSLNKVFFTNSGTESVEAAIKFAILSTGKSHLVAATRGFHGRTIGSLSLTHKPKYRKPFVDVISPYVTHAKFNDFRSVVNAANENTAAIVLEPVLGEGGVVLGDPEFFREVREFCTRKGILLIIDEVQTGFGRTGTMFAYEWLGVVPDILCLAKAIAGGVPMGAVVVNKRISVERGMHGTTFGGNPLSAAAGIAAIRYIQSNHLPQRSRDVGGYFINRLIEHVLPLPNVREVRGVGLMIAVEFKGRSKEIVRRLQERGVLVIQTGLNVIRFLPPLIITRTQVDVVISALLETTNS